MTTGSKRKSIAFTIGGIALVIAGFVLLKFFPADEGVMEVLPYYFMGIGCGAFGRGAGELLRARALRGNPELAFELEVERTDERRIFIANAAKARAYDVMSYLFAALIICFGLMQVDLVVLLMLIAAFLFVEGVAIYQMVKLEKKL